MNNIKYGNTRVAYLYKNKRNSRYEEIYKMRLEEAEKELRDIIDNNKSEKLSLESDLFNKIIINSDLKVIYEDLTKDKKININLRTHLKNKEKEIIDFLNNLNCQNINDIIIFTRWKWQDIHPAELSIKSYYIDNNNIKDLFEFVVIENGENNKTGIEMMIIIYYLTDLIMNNEFR